MLNACYIIYFHKPCLKFCSPIFIVHFINCNLKFTWIDISALQHLWASRMATLYNNDKNNDTISSSLICFVCILSWEYIKTHWCEPFYSHHWADVFRKKSQKYIEVWKKQRCRNLSNNRNYSTCDGGYGEPRRNQSVLCT